MASQGQYVNAGLFIGEELKLRIPVGIPIVSENTLLLVGGVVMEEGAKKLHMLRHGINTRSQWGNKEFLQFLLKGTQL